MGFYKTNAVYQLLASGLQHPFVWVSGNAWMLVYGDQYATPRALVLVIGKSWPYQQDVMEAAEVMSCKSGIPLFFVEFDDSADSIYKVHFSKSGQQSCEITLDQLKDEFRKMGLPVQSGACGKSVNDAESSAYHKWQRNSLGSIKVTDIDLIRLSDDGQPIEAIELKRSFSPLQDWNPYASDYVNFNLLLAVCRASDMRMTIAYNVRKTKPVFNDDASRLALFSYAAAGSPERLGQFDFHDFVAGNY